jgi:hypothetical protein
MGWIDAFVVFIHIPAGVLATFLGAGAMLAAKGGPAHIWRGRAYLLALAVVCATGLALVATRGPRFLHLAPLGVLAASLGAIGYFARPRPRASLHIVGMGLSYIAMLTAFYVDNGPKLPGWRLLPPLAFWILPTFIGAPLIVRAMRRHTRQPELQVPPVD